MKPESHPIEEEKTFEKQIEINIDQTLSFNGGGPSHLRPSMRSEGGFGDDMRQSQITFDSKPAKKS